MTSSSRVGDAIISGRWCITAPVTSPLSLITAPMALAVLEKARLSVSSSESSTSIVWF